MLIGVLQITPQGMRFIRIRSHEDPKTGQQESVVYMTGERVDLGHVIAKSGNVVGPKAQTLSIDGTRVSSGSGCNTENARSTQLIYVLHALSYYSAVEPLVVE